MNKILKFMAFAMMGVCSLTFTSCSNDDDDNGGSSSGNQIEVNGRKYPITDDYYAGISFWSETIKMGMIAVPVKTNRVPDYSFGVETFYFIGYTDTFEAGDDIANWKTYITSEYDENLEWVTIYGPVEMSVDASEHDLSNKKFVYKSGSGKIIDITSSNNTLEGTITIKFDNLVMVCEADGTSYTFNGTVTLPYND